MSMPDPNQMKAVIFEQYGGADALKIVTLPIPEPRDRQVLVRIHAAGVNPLDWKIRNGEMKFIPGQHFPHGVGSDFAGVVAKVGSAVHDFAEGEEVIGWTSSFRGGAYAEYIVVDAESLVAKPAALSFSRAASIPTAGTAALQGLRNVGHLQAGQSVLLNGCTGGVGIFAVPLAKSMGAHVTGVTSTKSLELARQMGADSVLDYKTTDIHSLSDRFDVIFDLAGRLPFEAAKPLLTPHGIYVDPVPSPAVMVGSVLENFFQPQKHGILMSKLNSADMKTLLQTIEQRNIDIVIGGTFPLDQAADAHRLGEAGGVVGKIVLQVV